MKKGGLAIVCSLLVSGCAAIATKPTRFEDERLRTDRNQVPSKDPVAHAKLDLEGTSVSLVAVRDCDLVERPVVRRTTRIESYNASPLTDWMLGAAGAGLVIWGGATLVDSSHVDSSDTSSRTYNPVGPAGAVAIGAALSVAGLGLLGLVGVDLVRANREAVSTAIVALDSEPVRRGVACIALPYARAVVTGAVDKVTFDLGMTDAQGRLSVDLDQALPSDWIVPHAAKMRVALADSDVGNVDLAAVYQVREGRAWAGADPERCGAPKDPEDCGPLRRFVSAYGDGPHGETGRATLTGSEPTRRRLAEATAWKSVNTPACVNGTDPDAMDRACQMVRMFMSEFPDGAHVKEAEAAAVAGVARARALRAATQRKQQAEQAAEDARERAELQQRCQAQCLVGCSRSFHEDSCLAGCLKLCTSQGQR
jgi:hypothetical protein